MSKGKATPRLRVRRADCNGCMSCQVYCVTSKEGICAPTRSRARIDLDPFGARHRITVCQQCEKARCAAACPEDAIALVADGSYWEIDHGRCTLCKDCVDACKLGAIHYDSVGDRIIKCDTCEGDPLCAQVCPMGALVWVDGKADDGE